MNRRSFLGSLFAAGVAASCSTFGQQEQRYPIAFSTLGCPDWEWTTVLREAARLGYAAIELRGIHGEMDLLKCPELAKGDIPQRLTELDNAHLKISDLGASSNMHERDPAKRRTQLDSGKRYIDLAVQLKAPYVRVFGNQYYKDEAHEKTVERVIAGLRELGEHARGTGVSVILESHGDFVDSPTLLKVMQGVNLPTVALLWDVHHTVRPGNEDPADTFAQLGSYVRHLHLKDSVLKDGKIQYVRTGEGTIPLLKAVQVLAKAGYKGFYCFEWEKRWHPELEKPEDAFPHYAQVMTGYLKSVGIAPRSA